MKGPDFFHGVTILEPHALSRRSAQPKRRFTWARYGSATSVLVLAFFLWPTVAWGHGERPQVAGMVMTDGTANFPWVLTDNQGLFAHIKDDYRWLCEDAISPGAGIRGLAVYGALDQRMVVATTAGLFTSEDGGCEWERAEGPVGGQRLIGLWQGANPDELLVASNHHQARNDVYKSRDGGYTWTAAGLVIDHPIHQLHRAHNAPASVYIQSRGRLWVSHDGADTFTPLPPLAHPARLLAVSPTDPDILFAATEAIPKTTIWRSSDGGMIWNAVLEVADLDLRMTLHPAGRDALLVGRVLGTLSSSDAGLNWVEGPMLPPAITRLEARPNGDLYVATDVYSGGPWVLGRSTDWGRTWRPVLSQFWDVSARWDCGPLTRGHACCRGLCPGRPPGAECGQSDRPASADQCLQPPGEPLDPRPDAAAAGGIPRDAAVSIDAGVSDVDEDASGGRGDHPTSSGGCQTSPLQSPLWWLYGALLSCFGRRRLPRGDEGRGSRDS